MQYPVPAKYQTPYLSAGPGDTEDFARELVAICGQRAVLALHGELGAGKTCFVRGLAQGLGLEDDVTSPTYTLIHEYPGDIPLVHMDLYRISGSGEAAGLGFDEYLESPVGILAVEWPTRAASVLPPETIHVELRPGPSPDERWIEVRFPGGAA